MSWLDSLFGMGGGIQEEESLEFPEDEIMWLFATALDERVCPDCGPLEGEVFPDSVLEETFPEYEELAEGVIHPHVHRPRDDNCRCTLFEEQPADEFSIGESDQQIEEYSLEIEVNKYMGGIF